MVGDGGQSAEARTVRELDGEEVLAAFRAEFVRKDSETADAVSPCEAFVALWDDIALPAVDRGEFRFDHGALDRLAHLVFDDGGYEYGWGQGHVVFSV